MTIVATTERSGSDEVRPSEAIRYDTVGSPIGQLLLISEGSALIGLELDEKRWKGSIDPAWTRDRGALSSCALELAAYFEGDLETFSLPLCPRGTPFQLDVWRALLAIEFATTTTYGEIAASIGRPRAARAVGGAINKNPIGIVIPCHRVIGADGSLTGFAAGLECKAELLELERSRARQTSASGGHPQQ